MLCLTGYAGPWYDDLSTENFLEIQNMFVDKRHDTINVTDGCDAICLSCPHLKNNTCMKYKDSMKTFTSKDNHLFGQLKLKPHIQYRLDHIARAIKRYLKHDNIEYVCSDCQFKSRCHTYMRYMSNRPV